MCGRYAASRDLAALSEVFHPTVPPTQELPPDYNVAPTKPVHVVRERLHEDGAIDREITVMRWGLVPGWAKDPSIGARMINARVETVAEKPAFRRAFSRRRVLLPADGYFEWEQPVETGEVDLPRTRAGRPAKQPWFIHPADGSVLAMAGVAEAWRDPSRDEDDPHAWLLTVAVITTAAADDLGRIHERMPLVVQPDAWAQWLDPREAAPADMLRLLVPAASVGLAAHPVSTAVNNVRNNGPDLVVPVALPGRDDDGDAGPESGTLF